MLDYMQEIDKECEVSFKDSRILNELFSHCNYVPYPNTRVSDVTVNVDYTVEDYYEVLRYSDINIASRVIDRVNLQLGVNTATEPIIRNFPKDSKVRILSITKKSGNNKKAVIFHIEAVWDIPIASTQNL